MDAELARAIRDVAAAVRGHENRTGSRLLPAALLPGVEPVTVGQMEVEEQRLEALAAGDVEEARHRRDGLHVVAPAGEETYEVLRQQLLVFEDEYPASHDSRVEQVKCQED